VGTAVGMRVDGNHLHRRGARVNMKAGSGGGDGGGIIALEKKKQFYWRWLCCT